MHVRPDLENSAMLLAFEGWNDAAEAATSALSYVNDALLSVPLAEIDADDFYDFTVRRPQVVLDDCVDGRRKRRIVWPATEFRYGTTQVDRPIVVGAGIEPHLRWRSYCECVAQVAEAVGVRRIVILGSYLADVVYSQPVVVTGVSSGEDGLASFDMDGSAYEGPTGIVGVLSEELASRGHEVACLWAGVPHYISASPNPRAALALVQTLSATLEIRLDEARSSRKLPATRSASLD